MPAGCTQERLVTVPGTLEPRGCTGYGFRSSASVTKPSLLQCTFQSREGRTLHAATWRKGGEKKKQHSIKHSGEWRFNKQNIVSRAEYRAGKCKLEAATSWSPLPATSAHQYACRVGGLPSHGSHAVQAVRARALLDHRDSHARGIQAHRTRIARITTRTGHFTGTLATNKTNGD